MNNLDLIREHCAEVLRLAQEIDDAQPAPAHEYKLEAGCKVQLKAGLEASNARGYTQAVVVIVHGKTVYTDRPLDSETELSRDWLTSELTVIAPATPEVGDYVRLKSSGGHGIIAGWVTDDQNIESYEIRSPAITHYLFRDRFHIIAKAQKQEAPDA